MSRCRYLARYNERDLLQALSIISDAFNDAFSPALLLQICQCLYRSCNVLVRPKRKKKPRGSGGLEIINGYPISDSSLLPTPRPRWHLWRKIVAVCHPARERNV